MSPFFLRLTEQKGWGYVKEDGAVRSSIPLVRDAYKVGLGEGEGQSFKKPILLRGVCIRRRMSGRGGGWGDGGIWKEKKGVGGCRVY